MSIDSITVGAQIANFLVLVWLLKRFLYRPILDGIDAREAEIAARMGEAAQIEAEAETQKADYEARISELQASRAETLEAAREAADEERRDMLAKARLQFEQEQAERAATRAEETRRFRADLQKTGGEALIALTRKALNDLADETLEARIVTQAATQLPDMASRLDACASEAVIVTRDPLPDDTRQRLREALGVFAPTAKLRFETDRARSPGLSLKLGAVEVDWTIEQYLDDLNAMLDEPARGARAEGGRDAG